MFMTHRFLLEGRQIFSLKFEHCINIGSGYGLVPPGNKL